MSLEPPRPSTLFPTPSPSCSPAPAAAATTCDVAIKHAARADTTLYLSLLPAELRREVDRCCAAWHFTGTLTASAVPLLLSSVLAQQFEWRGQHTLVLGLADEKVRGCVVVRTEDETADGTCS